MSQISEKLTTKQQTAVIALISEQTIEAAAARAGINRRTLQRWMRQDRFVGACNDARRQVYNTALHRLQLSTESAVSTLLEIQKSQDLPASARVRAALGHLAAVHKYVENQELTERVDRLEQMLGDKERECKG